ncbi:MAG: SAM-dependent methyltransferase [Clostridiales bacterium]|nr:SAM-dependent methyltransferase [Clostridiales bacterium]
MASRKTVQSVEPQIADMVNSWLRSYRLDYKLQQEPLTTEIDTALDNYFSKNGGTGGNIPDAKLLLKDQHGNSYPILIEYKGYENKLVKRNAKGQIENKTGKNEPNFKNINSYAVNGAVHYANAILHYTGYTDVIAIGVTGYKDDCGDLHHSIGVYYVSKSNFGMGQEILCNGGEYSDLSFLKLEHFDAFMQDVKLLQLAPEELEQIKAMREQEINASLVKLNNDIYKNEKGLGENDRVYLVAASIIATLGIPGKVTPLEKDDLTSSLEAEERDGDKIVRKIRTFLDAKNTPRQKRDLIVRTLSNTLLNDNINKPGDGGESQLKRVFCKIYDDLGIYYKIGLTTDFTGKLFNEMYSWLGFTQDKLNDVVLTPSYVATLLVKLARVDRNSYVWDFATGSAGLLVAAMNEMLIDLKRNETSPDEIQRKSAKIKAEQLLGLEILPNIYMLAVLNMILMGDGSANILNDDSLKDFNGAYKYRSADGEDGREQGHEKKFPATAFVLNPPYSAPGNGMNFVEKALSMMKNGYAAIIIQNSAGSGKAVDYNRRILKHSTLLASIKMPIDLFIGKSSVQTNVYVFRVGEAHQADETVRFIDFSYDGYTRTNRKKASSNLRDTDHAKERYQEVVDLVRFGKSKLHFLNESDFYEGHIDPNNGCDWNQTAPIDTRPTLDDFKKTVSDYLAWEVSTLLKNQDKEDDRLGK